MDRRSFVLSLFGGVAAAGIAGSAFAASRPELLAAGATAPGALDAATSAALDQADAEFSQVVVRERVVRRRPRRPVVRERVIVRRPRRPVRRRVIRERVIIR